MKKQPPYDELRKMVVETKDFHAFWIFFFDSFMECEAFRDAGEPYFDKKLEETIRELSEKLLGKSRVKLNHVMLIEIPEQKMIHGFLIIEGKMASFVLFNDIFVGMLSIVVAPDTGETRYLRMTPAHLEKLKPATDKVQ